MRKFQRLGASPVTAPAPLLIRVAGGNGADDDRLIRAATKPDATAVYDPANPTGLPWPNGIGYGDRLNADGTTTRVLLAHWNGAPSTITTAIAQNTVVSVSEQTMIEDPMEVLDPQPAWIVRHV